MSLFLPHRGWLIACSDPRQCTYVGDQTTDRSFAQRCGFQFVDQAEFFAG